MHNQATPSWNQCQAFDRWPIGHRLPLAQGGGESVTALPLEDFQSASQAAELSGDDPDHEIVELIRAGVAERRAQLQHVEQVVVDLLSRRGTEARVSGTDLLESVAESGDADEASAQVALRSLVVTGKVAQQGLNTYVLLEDDAPVDH